MKKTTAAIDKNVFDLFALLRMALRFSTAEKEAARFSRETDWQALMQLSAEQNVIALAYDGMMQLPPELHPPRKLKINWGVNTELIKERNLYHIKVIRELADLFAAQGIRMMLLKGRGVAAMYPDPLLREECDIDIYLFGDFEKGNELIKENGIELISKNPKHSIFMFKGLQIENHCSFLDTHLFEIDKKLETYLFKYLQVNENSNSEKYYNAFLPAPDFNAIFLLRHAFIHLNMKETTSRHLCDWACFLTKCEINYKEFQNVMSEVSIRHLSNSFTSLAIQLLDLSLPYNIKRDEKIERIMLEAMITRVKKYSGNTLLDLFKYRCKRFWEVHNLYKHLYSEYNWVEIKSSIASLLYNPRKIVKLR